MQQPAGSARINLQGRLQGHRHLTAHLASDINLYLQARIGPVKSLLKATTKQSSVPRFQGAWLGVGGWSRGCSPGSAAEEMPHT